MIAPVEAVLAIRLVLPFKAIVEFQVCEPVVVMLAPNRVVPAVELMEVIGVAPPITPLNAVFAVPEFVVKLNAPSMALLNVTTLLVVLTIVLAANVIGPANVISAAFAEPVVMVPDNVVRPVCVALPITMPANLPPLPKIVSVPSNIALVIFKVLPVTPTPIVLELV